MNDRPLLVFDFDGVIVDGMAEYWWSAWHACRRLEAAPEGLTPDQVPDAFRQLRPWVHHGWEMVLLAAELPVLKLQDWLDVQPILKLQHRQLRGQQNHLPTVMHPRPQLSEGVRDLIRRQALWSSLKTTTGMPGTPPVLRHAINDDPVEVEDQEGAIIHGRKLGR